MNNRGSPDRAYRLYKTLLDILILYILKLNPTRLPATRQVTNANVQHLLRQMVRDRLYTDNFHLPRYLQVFRPDTDTVLHCCKTARG